MNRRYSEVSSADKSNLQVQNAKDSYLVFMTITSQNVLLMLILAVGGALSR